MSLADKLRVIVILCCLGGLTTIFTRLHGMESEKNLNAHSPSRVVLNTDK